ncbi:MAG: hypothetical protein NVS3B20_04480 [Polyangiales bacterium]
MIALLFSVSACDRSAQMPSASSTSFEPLHASSTASSTAPSTASSTSAAVAGVEIRNGAKSGSVEIVAHEAISLDARLFVERETETGAFLPVYLDMDSMKLVESCGEKIGACVSLDIGHTLKPVPWSGASCSSQCNLACGLNFLHSGSHRFVVVSCDGKQRFEGPRFDLRYPPSLFRIY